MYDPEKWRYTRLDIIYDDLVLCIDRSTENITYPFLIDDFKAFIRYSLSSKVKSLVIYLSNIDDDIQFVTYMAECFKSITSHKNIFLSTNKSIKEFSVSNKYRSLLNVCDYLLDSNNEYIVLHKERII